MSKHPTQIELKAPPFTVTIEPLELGHALSELRYDSLANYVRCLSTKLQIDADMQGRAGRTEVSRLLELASGDLVRARTRLEQLWELVQPPLAGSKKEPTEPKP